MTRVDLEEGGARVAHVVTDVECAAACPSCGVFSSSVQGHAITRPRDVPYGEKAVALGVARAMGAVPGSSVSSWLVHGVDAGRPGPVRIMTRLGTECGAGVAQGFSGVWAAAARYRVSWPIARRADIDHVEGVLTQPLPPVTVLGIDDRVGNR